MLALNKPVAYAFYPIHSARTVAFGPGPLLALPVSCCGDTFSANSSFRAIQSAFRRSVDYGWHRHRCTSNVVPLRMFFYRFRRPCRTDGWSCCRNRDSVPAARRCLAALDGRRLRSLASAATGHPGTVLVAGWSTDWTRRTSIAMVTASHSSALTWTTTMATYTQSFADTNAAGS